MRQVLAEECAYGYLQLTEQAQGKYDRYVPDDLVSAAYAADQLDLDGAVGALRGIMDTSVGAS